MIRPNGAALARKKRNPPDVAGFSFPDHRTRYAKAAGFFIALITYMDNAAETSIDMLIAAVSAQTEAINALAASNMALVDAMQSSGDAEGDDEPPVPISMSRRR